MSVPAAGRRGQPLIFLFCLIGGWAMLRVATWENPWPQQIVPEWIAPAMEQLALAPGANTEPATGSQASMASAKALTVKTPSAPPLFAESTRELLDAQSIAREFAIGRTVAGHNLVWMSAMSRLPMPNTVAAVLDGRREAVAAPSYVDDGETRPARWRFDGWLQLRGGTSTAATGGVRPASYGASQLGGVLAYRLFPRSQRDPAIYLRASSALREPGESEAAIGLRARPVTGLPISLHAELRATQRPDRAELRPAAFAVIGFEDRDLPLGLGARGYAQAGYVGGTFATGFADGHLIVDYPVASFDLGDVRTGAGAWGGVQRDAARIDVGPTASVDLEFGEVPARVSVDYRIRVAGDAEPGNGPALTLSTGF